MSKRYEYIYRCSGDDLGDMFSFCDFSTTSYAACDAHEDSNLGHLMTGRLEEVEEA